MKGTFSPACSAARQAGRREWDGGWLISKCSLSLPPSFTEAGCPFAVAVPRARGLSLLSGCWLTMLHAAPEVSAHSNPWGTHLHLSLQGLFFLRLCNIVWEAAAKSCANVTCTFLVNEELSSLQIPALYQHVPVYSSYRQIRYLVYKTLQRPRI